MEKLLNKQMAVWMIAVVTTTLSIPLRAQEKPAGGTTSGWERETTVPKTENVAANSLDDTGFMKRAYEAGSTEINLGNVAMQNAASEQVKQYAQRLVDDFTRANQELQSIADAKMPPVASTGHSASLANTQSAAPVEKERYPYLHNETLRKDMEDFNVSGSGLGTGGGTMGTALSRPGRSKRPSRPSDYAGMGAGTGTPTGSGFGGTPNKDSASISPTTTTQTDDSRASAVRPSPKPGSILSAELSQEHLAMKDKLMFLSGSEFDRAYVKVAKTNHDNLISLLEAEVNGGGDEQVKQWASKYLTMVRAYKNPLVKTTNTNGSRKASSSQW